MNEAEHRTLAVMDKYKEYLSQAAQIVEASGRLLQNLDEIFAASVNLQHFIVTRKPEYDSDGNKLIDVIFQPDRSSVTMYPILSSGNKSMSSFTVRLVKELEKAVLDPAHAAKLLVLSKDKFEKKYPEMYPAVEYNRYTLCQAILKSILT